MYACGFGIVDTAFRESTQLEGPMLINARAVRDDAGQVPVPVLLLESKHILKHIGEKLPVDLTHKGAFGMTGTTLQELFRVIAAMLICLLQLADEEHAPRVLSQGGRPLHRKFFRIVSQDYFSTPNPQVI